MKDIPLMEILIASMIVGLACLVVWSITNKTWQRECVEHGVAHFEPAGTDYNKFVWDAKK